MFRQDSIEDSRNRDLERRFEMVMRMVRRETNGERPDLEEKAKQMYFINNDKTAGTTDLALENAEKSVDKTTVADNEPIELLESKGTNENDALAVKKDATENYAKIGIKNNQQQKDAVANVAEQTTTVSTQTKDNTRTDKFTQAATRNNIKSRKFRNLDGVADGYYLVANVYKGEYYMHKFIDKLNSQGIEADYFENPNNGLKYVYLKRTDNWKEALDAYQSNNDGTYNADLWVMNVDNRYTNEAYVENTNKIKEKSAKYSTDVLQKNVIVKDKLAANGLETKNIKIEGVGSGFYIIANVFANPKNANRFVKLLNSQGLSASYFINPENNYRYVYLKRHESWNNALLSYYTKLNDAYHDKMWIMRVTPNLIT